MQFIELVEKVTALVDNEIKDEEEVRKIKLLLKENENLNIEYQVQSLIKNSLRNKFSTTTAPIYLEKRIKKNLNDDLKAFNQKTSSLSHLYSIFRKPQVSIAFVIMILILYFFLPNHSDNYQEILKSQIGNSNMLVQAEQNFSKILNGKLNVQFSSNNSDKLKKFFLDNGVSYQTTIPVFNDLELLGGVVSENNDRKFAHHLYRCKSGKLVYIYQVPEDWIRKEKVINLSDSLIELIDKEKKCSCILETQAVIVWKCKNNLIVLISNDDLNMLEGKFLAEN